jgi:hypothetical protein
MVPFSAARVGDLGLSAVDAYMGRGGKKKPPTNPGVIFKLMPRRQRP